MVSTRSHPSTFPPPELSPSKALTQTTNRNTTTRTRRPDRWTHTPDLVTVAWLLISLPLVIWDTLYVLLRPHTMPGGAYNWPFYTPYDLYGTIDYIYGWKAWNEKNGFTAAQGTLNLLETAGYLGYLYVLWKYGEGEGFGRRKLAGGWGGVACLCGFALAVMTVSKTLLYLMNEAFSGFANIGHNDAFTLVFLWIMPNGAWIVFPSYMAYVFGRDILHGLSIASGDSTSKPARAASPTKED